MRKGSFLFLTAILCLVFLSTTGVYDRADAASQVIELKFANYFPPPARHSKLCEEFIADLERRTGGRVKVQFFAGGSLLKAPAMFQGVTTGIADIGFSHVEYTPGRMPVTEAVGLPLGYPSGWVANQVANDFYDQFKPKEWKDVEVLWMHTSTPNVIISKKPVRTLEDLKGMTLRAPGTIGDTVKALGATPAPTPVMEVYDAMSKGVIDGVNIPFETLKTFRFAEVAKFTTASWQVGNVYPFYVIMNKNSYKKLTPELKQIFDRLCGEFKERCALMWNLIDFEGKEFAIQQNV
ncbi:MAG: TRAP transporter substrate-binding protein, partial [Deltaproteobacteria bacterium]|nr:TRAP transporter substrate-binding protein [Deltaproteobacteria bacterium]